MNRFLSALAASALVLAAVPASARPTSGGRDGGADLAVAVAMTAPAPPQSRTRHLGTVSRDLEEHLTRSDPTTGDGAYFDCYSFDLRAGQQFAVAMFSVDFDAYLSLHAGGECNDEIASDDDGLEGTDPVIEDTIVRSGRYSVAATSLYSGETGLYGLTLIIK